MNSVGQLLVGSVYGPSPYNANWLELQQRFLGKNCFVPFEHKVILNNVQGDLFHAEQVVAVNDKNIGHPAALAQLIAYMRDVQDAYDAFLILDSDCFPVHPGWHFVLDQQMGRFNKCIAAPIRYENLDRFPHPCAVYMDKTGLNHPGLDFSYAKVKNLMGDEINEVGGAMYKIRDEVLPLLRTNRINLHPVAAGIYHDVFYHHGAGSRGFQFRVVHDYDYYPSAFHRDNDQWLGGHLTKLLFDDPSGFISKLMFGD